MSRKFRLTLLATALFTGTTAFATDGYFSHSFGVQSQGMGGVGIALPLDGLTAATNPVGTAFVADRVDAGVSLFQPDRNAQITANGAGANGNYDGNGKSNFYTPELGYIRKLNETTTAGLAIDGNGGMNTQHNKNPFGAFGSTGNAGINLSQLFISPSLAYKVNEQNSLGLAVNFAYQQFSADGLQAFATASASPANLTNRGVDTSTGWGVRLGGTGNVTPDQTLGASWASKLNASNFSNYSGLFSGGGSFDIPENFGLGLAYKITPAWMVASDADRIKYSGVNSIANPLSNLTVLGNPLGSANGAGFGWQDVTVVKLGVSYAYNPEVTLRGGYNHSGQPVPNSQTFFNILAPGVVQNHLTLGGSWKTSKSGELGVS